MENVRVRAYVQLQTFRLAVFKALWLIVFLQAPGGTILVRAENDVSRAHLKELQRLLKSDNSRIHVTKLKRFEFNEDFMETEIALQTAHQSEGEHDLLGQQLGRISNPGDRMSESSRRITLRQLRGINPMQQSHDPKLTEGKVESQRKSPDISTLLAIRKGVTEDPHAAMWNWNADSDPCGGWVGVVCDPVSYEVIDLNLANYGLHGTLSSKLGALKSLRRLVLSKNRFTSTIPNSLGDASDLRIVELDSNNLDGTIPDSLGKLSKLESLDLHDNELTGPIPFSLGRCSHLKVLALSGNQLTGTIPSSLENCAGLQILDLCDNQLNGDIPAFVNNFSDLVALQISRNDLTGRIPEFSENCSKLQVFAGSSNELTGEIPGSIGHCSSLHTVILDKNRLSGTMALELELLSNLTHLSISGNSITGMIPGSLSHLESLTFLQLSENQLSGEIPLSLWESNNLKFLYLQKNRLSGSLPATVRNCTALRELVLSDNHLRGPLPFDLGYLPNLRVVRLANNGLTGMIPESFGNCSALEELDLSNNVLFGSIPEQLGHLAHLRSLLLSFNSFSGSIPVTLTKCGQLKELQLATNLLSGAIPRFRRLQVLQLSDNQFGGFPDFLASFKTDVTKIDLSMNYLTGPIPATIGNFTNLQSLNLANNMLTGQIPLELFECGTLEVLVLNDNLLSGPIPSDIGRLTLLSTLNLSNNNLTGAVPSEIGNCSSLVDVSLAHNKLSGSLPGTSITQLIHLSARLDISANHFSGLLPEDLGHLVSLRILNVSFNSFVYRIPPSIANCAALVVVDLSHNHLCGEIPEALALLPNLTFFSVAANNMEGPIPTSGIFSGILPADSFLLNPRLCGHLIGKNCTAFNDNPTCHGFLCNWIAFTSAFIGVILVGTGVTIWYCLFIKVIEYHRKTLGPEMPHVPQMKVTVHDLTKATDAFSSSNIIGIGARSTVFKGTLPSGALIAVKKLEKERSTSGINLWNRKDLYREVDFLGKLRHPNLLKTLSVCWNLDTKALVFNFMVNGTLDQHLHGGEPDEATKLNWDLRFNVALGVAQGLVYLHHDLPEQQGGGPVIHGDLKPSNIFLEEDFTPKVSDYGLAKLIMPDLRDIEEDDEASEAALNIGTPDYIAAECMAPATRFTCKGDVYSYGVILLELVTGMRPIGNGIDYENDKTLVAWVREANMPENVIDKRIQTDFEHKGKKQQMLLTLQAGMLCTQDCPQKRPDMKEVLEILGRSRDRMSISNSTDENYFEGYGKLHHEFDV